MIIRKATYKELQLIKQYAFDVLDEATMGNINPTIERVEEMMTSIVNNEGYYLLDMDREQIKGWIGIGTSYDYLNHQEVGVIAELYVLPIFRKQGIAVKLIEEAIKQLNDSGYKKIQLQVYAGNQAKHLYKKLGFEEVVTMMEKDLRQ